MPTMTLDELRARKEERERARAEKVEALEREALELEEKYESEGKSLGIDFAIVTTSRGNFAVKRPEFIAARQFLDSKDKSVEEAVKFANPHVLFPARETLGTLFQEHGGIALKLAAALLGLYQADVDNLAGK